MKKTLKILKKKRDLEEQIIKPNKNTFNILFQIANRSGIYSNNMLFITNYYKKHI